MSGRLWTQLVRLILLGFAVAGSFAACTYGPIHARFQAQPQPPRLEVPPLPLRAALILPESVATMSLEETISCWYSAGSWQFIVPFGQEVEWRTVQTLSQAFETVHVVPSKTLAMGHYDALIEFAPSVFKIEKDCHSGVFVTTSILTGGIILLMGFASPLISMEAHLDLSATVYDRQGQIILASASYKAKTPVIRTGETGGPEERFLGEAFEKVLAEALKEVTLRVAAAPKLQQYAQALPRPPTAQREPAAPLLAQPSDVDTLPLTTSVPSKHRHAVVIGIEQYRQQLPRADLATQDARIMGEYVTKVMGYAEENVVLLLNERAAKSDLEKYLEKWLPNRVEPGDSVFLYFSGHGAPNPKTGEAYLVPYDGDPGFVDTTGYPLKRLYEHLAKLPAKEVVVLLDSCFSGAGGRSVLAKGMRPMVLSVENPLLASGKTVVLAASAGDQVSSTYIQKGHGLLTYFVLKGLRGEADQNQDGTLELAELFSYVKPQVERIARREFNNEQTPHLLGSPEVLTKGVRLVERARP